METLTSTSLNNLLEALPEEDLPATPNCITSTQNPYITKGNMPYLAAEHTICEINELLELGYFENGGTYTDLINTTSQYTIIFTFTPNTQDFTFTLGAKNSHHTAYPLDPESFIQKISHTHTLEENRKLPEKMVMNLAALYRIIGSRIQG